MIHRLNEQVLGSPDSEINTARNEVAQRRAGSSNSSKSNDHQQLPAQSEKESAATSSLRSLVEETALLSPAQVLSAESLQSCINKNCKHHDDDSSSDGSDSMAESSTKNNSKRPAVPTTAELGEGSPYKKARSLAST
jgi:hypothetical protein